MCVLRVSGSNFDAEEFLRTSGLRPCNVFKAGDRRVPSRPHGSVHVTSGLTVAVSDAAWSNLPGQVSDACAFLGRHAAELRALAGLETVEDMRLDFSVELRIGQDGVVAQFDYLPPELIKAAGAVGVGIELSTYACSEEEDIEKSSA